MDQPSDIAVPAAAADILPEHKSRGAGDRASTAPAKKAFTLSHNALRPPRMAVDTPGDIGSLCFVDDESLEAPLGPDEVEIKALAYALDQADIDLMLANEGNTNGIGECSGLIIRRSRLHREQFQAQARSRPRQASGAE
jgi:hypothetical protein